MTNSNSTKNAQPSANSLADSPEKKLNGLRWATWQKDGHYSMVNGPWRITKYKVDETWDYMLFYNDKRMSLHDSFEEAQNEITRLAQA